MRGKFCNNCLQPHNATLYVTKSPIGQEWTLWVLSIVDWQRDLDYRWYNNHQEPDDIFVFSDESLPSAFSILALYSTCRMDPQMEGWTEGPTHW